MKIELSELQRIIGRATEIDTTLSQELGNMSTTLNDICQNVNSSELTASNQKITTAIVDLNEKVKANLPKVISFLNEQIKSYSTTNETTKSQIDSLVSAVDQSLGMQ